MWLAAQLESVYRSTFSFYRAEAINNQAVFGILSMDIICQATKFNVRHKNVIQDNAGGRGWGKAASKARPPSVSEPESRSQREDC